MIGPGQWAEIRRLFYAEHWPLNTIAANLGLHHTTVRRAVESEDEHSSVVPSHAPARPSKLDPYKPLILAALEQYPRLRASRLFHMLCDRGYVGSARILRRYVRIVRPVAMSEAFLRLDTLPGEQAQVDWGHFGYLQVGHARRPLSCFVLVLSWARAMYAHFALDQSMQSFLRGHVQAFHALGGVPRGILYDNLKSVVLERSGDHFRFHPHLLELAGHYHFAPHPCAVARGNEKGRVERTIRYLRDSFFAARHFSSLEDLNAQLARWIADIAHARPRPGDPERRSVAQALEEERPRLLPLPEHPFACHLLRSVVSGKTPYVRLDGNDYSIPHRLVRRPLTLVADEHTVRILDGSAEVARHPRSWDRGQRIEDPAHLAELAREKRHAHELHGRDRLRHACPHADAFIDELARRGEPLARHTQPLLSLLDLYGPAELDRALAEALHRGALSAPSVAHLLDQQSRARRSPPPLPMPLPDDPRVRDLRVTPHSLAPYDELGSGPSTATPTENTDGQPSC
jgi:transposase